MRHWTVSAFGSGNGLSPFRCQAITGTNGDLLSIGTLGINFSEILIEILTFSFKKMRLNMSSAKWLPFCSGGDELTNPVPTPEYSVRAGSIPLLLMPWLLATPGHQEP